MLGGKKNLTDSKSSLKDTTGAPVPYQAMGFSSGGLNIPYTKTNKLITALYLVTDIIPPGEPLRTKLRALGADILSDIGSATLPPRRIGERVSVHVDGVVSFLDIAGAVNMVSPMNLNILKKEFFELRAAVAELMAGYGTISSATNLEEFFREDGKKEGDIKKSANLMNNKHIGHGAPTRLGVQKGGTLLKALSDTTSVMSDTVERNDVSRKQRRDEIIAIIKVYGETYPTLGGATITDIRMKAEGVLASCGEKTIQRELVAMVSDGVLKKAGLKRWSRYSLQKS